MILAAGLGKRMQPVTKTTPKPLLTISGRTLLDHNLDHCVNAGVAKVIINLHHLASQIVQHLEKRKDLEIFFSDETNQLLETGGGIVKA